MAQREITDCEPYRTLDDPTVSRWLKDALRASLDRDPVDAANDAEYLATILAERCAALPKGKDGSMLLVERQAHTAAQLRPAKPVRPIQHWRCPHCGLIVISRRIVGIIKCSYCDRVFPLGEYCQA